jgi:hypothetical protein
MRYLIQNASANDTQRDDGKINSKDWETVASGQTLKEALEFFIRALNDEEVSIENGWIRLVDTETNEVICC